jgi:hypothetical protein
VSNEQTLAQALQRHMGLQSLDLTLEDAQLCVRGRVAPEHQNIWRSAAVSLVMRGYQDQWSLDVSKSLCVVPVGDHPEVRAVWRIVLTPSAGATEIPLDAFYMFITSLPPVTAATDDRIPMGSLARLLPTGLTPTM